MAVSSHRGVCTGVIRFHTELEIHYSWKNILVAMTAFSILALLFNIYYISRHMTAFGNDDAWEKLRRIDFEESRILRTLDEALGRLSKFDNRSYNGQRHKMAPLNDSVTIAIGCAISTHNTNINTSGEVKVTELLENMPFFTHLMRGFCLTASEQYRYYFYIAYDYNDPLFKLVGSETLFREAFRSTAHRFDCQHMSLYLRFVRCEHSKSPAWAQNDAMMSAYLDNMDFYYRINDDTVMIDGKWTEKYIQTLAEFNPPNVGVVGPDAVCADCDSSILTYDFVHRTHVEIFGYYYPRQFPEWYADKWITLVYKYVGRMIQLPDVQLAHTRGYGMRYDVSKRRASLLPELTSVGVQTINSWIDANTEHIPKIDKPKKVIAYSLFGKKKRYWHGALRNAQLLGVFFPSWVIRIYLEPQHNSKDSLVQKYCDNLKKRKNVQIIEVPPHISSSVSPTLWRFLVADDESIDAFLIRDLDTRLGARDKTLVDEWLASGRPFHLIRDHPNDVLSVRGGLVGGKPKELHKILKRTFLDLVEEYTRSLGSKPMGNFIQSVILPEVGELSLSHESVVCSDFLPDEKNTKKVDIPRGLRYDHVGQKFNEFEVPRQFDIDILRHQKSVMTCSP